MFYADYHAHSDCLEGRVEKMQEYVQRAHERGIRRIGFSEHYWNGKFPGWGRWYKPRMTEDLYKIREDAAELSLPEGMSVRIGCETEFSQENVIPLTKEDLAALDYIVVPHSHINMTGVVTDRIFKGDPAGAAQFMINSFWALMAHPLAEQIDILAHPFAPVGMDEEQDEVLSYISDEEFRRCARAARDLGIVLEINSLTWRDKTMEQVEKSGFIRLFGIAKEEGCRFTYGSDAHRAEQYDLMPFAQRIAVLAGITREDMHNIP